MVNQVTFDFRDNPDLRAAFSGKKIGDKCRLEMGIQVDSLTEEGLVGTVQSVAADGYKPAAGGDVKPTEAEPVMIMIAGKRHDEAATQTASL